MRFAEQLLASNHIYFGRRQLADIERYIPTVQNDKAMLVRATASWGSELLRLGRAEPAIEKFREAKRLAVEQNVPARLRDLAVIYLGIAEMRLGELQNCCARHTPDSCILPIQGGGVHTDKTGVHAAMAQFREFLQNNPNDPTPRWLLNVAAMAAGEWPSAVPEQWRFPTGMFQSEHDVKRFPDIAMSVGVDADDQAGGAITEDFDNDGFLDILCTTSFPSGPMHYFHNNGRDGFEDWTQRAGLHGQLGGLHCNQTDFNNDGWLDVLILRGGWTGDLGKYTRNSLLRNNGDGTFSDVTHAAGLATPHYATQTGAWADYDNDGDVDLFVGNEGPLDKPDAYRSQLFRNNGDETFTEVAAAAGVENMRYAKGSAWGDYDDDGYLDLYVSNIGPNRLYHNNRDGTFTDVAEQLGVTQPVGRSFATWFFDYDNDGDLDLYVNGYEGGVKDVAAWYFGMPDKANRPRLYRNNGAGGFDDITREAGLFRPMLPMGCDFGDLDNDGWLDFYLGTGAPNYEALTPNVMFRNDGGRRFQDVTFSGGFGHLQKGHSVAWADLDNDGDQDVYHQLGGFVEGDTFRNVLFENPGHGNHWVTLRCVGAQSNRAAIGARLRVSIVTPGGRRDLHRAVGLLSSFGGSTLQQEIGLGDATSIEEIEVWWPKTGERQRFAGPPMDAAYDVHEGESALRPLPRQAITFRKTRGGDA